MGKLVPWHDMNPRVELFVQKAIRFILILCGGEGSQKAHLVIEKAKSRKMSG